MQDFWLAALWSVLPTIVVGAVFYYVMRSVIRADRNERREYARIEAKERAKRGLPPRTGDANPDRADGAASITPPSAARAAASEH